MFSILFYIIIGLLIPWGLVKSEYEFPTYRFAGINWDIRLLLFFIITVLVRGLAYNTGQDYWHYSDYYDNIVADIPDDWGEHTEWGFRIVVYILASFFSSPSAFFILSSIIVMAAMIRISQRYENAEAWIMMLWWWFMHVLSFNLYRQYFAISFVLLSYFFYKDKDYKKAILFVVLSVLFHTSSILPIAVVYVIDRFSYIRYSRWTPIILVVLTTCLSKLFMSQIAEACDLVSVYYSLVTGQVYEGTDLLDTAYDASILLFPNMIVYIIWLWLGYDYCEEHHEFKGIFNIFALSLILTPITRQEILMRICLYFVSFSPIILGVMLSSDLKRNRWFLCSLAYMFLYYCYTLSFLLDEFPLTFSRD